MQTLVHPVQDRTVEQLVRTVALDRNAVEVVAVVQVELQPKRAQALVLVLVLIPNKLPVKQNQILIPTILFTI